MTPSEPPASLVLAAARNNAEWCADPDTFVLAWRHPDDGRVLACLGDPPPAAWAQ
ncbi:hypothetical protein ACWGIB_19350 [Streptomyces xiamenensis]